MTPNIQTTRKNLISPTQMKLKKKTKNKLTSKSIDDKENTSSSERQKSDDPHSMDFELESAVDLIKRFIEKSHSSKSQECLQNFENSLLTTLKEHYTGHWYPESPLKGSGFRCLRINQNGGDSLIEMTAKTAGLLWIAECLPREFTIWIDPGEVSYRIGEEGSICVHYTRKQQTLPGRAN